LSGKQLTTDVLIVGGGPAGLATALALRQRGATVTVADAVKPPIDKACGEGLMPDSLYELASLGVDISVGDGAAFRGIRFVNHHIGNSHRGREIATARFPTESFASGTGTGIGLRRQTLHSRLAQRAEELGVVLRWQSPVQLKPNGQVLVAGKPLQYNWLVGADGHNSRVRKWAGLERGSILSRRFGFRRHFQVEPWSPYVEVHWGKTGQAYVTPVGPNEVCVATIARGANFRLEAMLEELPWLRDKLAGCATSEPNPTDRERGALTTTRRLERVVRGKVILVGDASGSADAITGEGMGMAFRQALLLAECLEANNLGRYNRLHPDILQLPQTMARVMLLMDRSETFRDRALHMLASEPALFSRMLGVHLGSESLLRFITTRGLEVAWRLAVQSNAIPASAAVAS
jgi:2-polyprenyl-6-methoxyphenol hydroxylase-like FAD-dependent oxidoreductase